VLEYQRADGKKWHRILYDEYGLAKPGPPDIEGERSRLMQELGRLVTNEELVLFLQFPFDALNFFKFVEKYGKTWLLPPEVWFRRGGFQAGEHLSFADEYGVPHHIEVISSRREGPNVLTTLLVDHSFQTFSIALEGGGA
jgi:pyruvate carboxylase